MGFFESDSERKQEEHNRGQGDGASSNIVADIVRDLTPLGWIGQAFESDEYKEGYQNGRDNRPKD